MTTQEYIDWFLSPSPVRIGSIELDPLVIGHLFWDLIPWLLALAVILWLKEVFKPTNPRREG